jgi:NADP-dependent 3-hydroxy acid dehydrogenase YdfG
MALNPRLTDWHGKTTWIVGASSGIGRATAQVLHARGAKVVVSARNQAALDAFVAEHPGSVAQALDVSDEAAVAKAAAKILASHGTLDVVFACAGYYKAHRATHFELASMKQHLDVNVTGTLNLLAAVMPVLMKQKHGHISLMGSVAGYRGLPNGLAYGPTKAYLNNLAECMYLDLHDEGLGVSVVNPGFVDTPLTAQNRFHMPALMTSEEAGRLIVEGWEQGLFEIHFPKRFTMQLKSLQVAWHGLYFAAVRRATGL